MVQFSQSHKKVLLITFVVIVSFCLFWFFIFVPSKIKVDSMRSELVGIQERIKQIQEITGSPQKGIKEVRDYYQTLSSFFPEKEEEALKQLSYLAKKHDVEIISIQPESKRDYPTGELGKIKEAGQTYDELLGELIQAHNRRELAAFARAAKQGKGSWTNIEDV